VEQKSWKTKSKGERVITPIFSSKRGKVVLGGEAKTRVMRYKKLAEYSQAENRAHQSTKGPWDGRTLKKKQTLANLRRRLKSSLNGDVVLGTKRGDSGAEKRKERRWQTRTLCRPKMGAKKGVSEIRTERGGIARDVRQRFKQR